VITTFHNVLISIEAESPEAAYELLCETLDASNSIEYTTDTYVNHNDISSDPHERDERSTSELWPE
jgi:hypothetical protein